MVLHASWARRSSLAVLAAALGGVAACDGDGVGSQSADASDSFARPTMHGALTFGVDASSSFTARERFHAWTFTLTGDAAVDLRTTELASNLDTVAYLYRREPGASTWGASIAQNDDHAGELASRIEADLGAGEYLIKVKATKTAMRGGFSLASTCTGDGCPTVAACEDGADVTLPAETGLAPSCAGDLAGVLLADVTGDRRLTTTFDGACDAGALVATAVGMYRSYWIDEVGWSDFDEANEGGEASVRVLEHGAAGATVGVDIGGDEDHVTFVFDGASQLLGYFHSEQSPRSAYHCADAGEEEAEAAPDECLGLLLRGLEHDVDDEEARLEGTVTQSDPGALGWSAPVVARYAASVGLGAEDPIAYALTTWSTIDDEEGARLVLDGGGARTTYLLLNDGTQVTVLVEGDAVTCAAL